MLKMWLPVSWYKEVIETSDSASCAFRRGNRRVKSSNPFSQVHVLAWGVNSRKLIWLTAADIVFGRNIIRAAPISDEITAAPPPSDLFQQELRALGRFKNTSLVSASTTAASAPQKISALNQNLMLNKVDNADRKLHKQHKAGPERSNGDPSFSQPCFDSCIYVPFCVFSVFLPRHVFYFSWVSVSQWLRSSIKRPSISPRFHSHMAHWLRNIKTSSATQHYISISLFVSIFFREILSDHMQSLLGTWLPTIFGAQMSTWHGGTPQTRFCLTLPSQTNWARIPAVKNGKANQFSRMLGIMQSKKCCRCEHNALQRTTHLLLFVFWVFSFSFFLGGLSEILPLVCSGSLSLASLFTHSR